MKTERASIIGGLIFILLGGYLSVVALGIVPKLPISVWAFVLAMISVLSFTAYVLGGWRAWGWLFPALIFGGWAAVAVLDRMNIADAWIGSIAIWSIAAPFWLVLLIERKRHWWPVIPGGILTSVGFMPLAESVLVDDAAAGIMLYGIALSFGLVFLFNRRRNWWALVPAGVLLFAGTFPLLDSLAVSEEIIGMFASLFIGLIFLSAFLFWRNNWWALIPAGLFVSAGLTAGASTLRLIPELMERVPPAIFFGGLALTFLAIWLQRLQQNAWARYPAAGLAVAAVVVLIFGEATGTFIGPLALLALGIWLLFRAVRPRSV